MVKYKPFKSTEQKLRKIFKKNRDHDVELQNFENTLILNQLASGHFKKPKIIYDSNWCVFQNAQWYSPYGYPVAHRFTYSEHLSFPTPVEYNFEPEIEIPERLLPFVKINLMVKKRPDIEIVGGTIWEGITIPENMRVLIYKGSELVYSGDPRLIDPSGLRQTHIDDDFNHVEYYTSIFYVRESDNNFVGRLDRFVKYDSKTEITNAYGVGGDNNPYDDPDAEGGLLNPYQIQSIYNIDKTEVRGFTEINGDSITGKGLRQQISWTLRSPSEYVYAGNTSVTSNHYHKYVTDTNGDGNTSVAYDAVTHAIVDAHTHTVSDFTNIWATGGHTHTSLATQHDIYDLDPIQKTSGVLKNVNVSDSNTDFYLYGQGTPSDLTGNHFEESLYRQAWHENTYNSKIIIEDVYESGNQYWALDGEPHAKNYPTGQAPSQIPVKIAPDGYPLLEPSDRNGRSIDSEQTFTWIRTKSGKTKYQKDKFKLYLRGALLVKIPAQKNSPVNTKTQNDIWTVITSGDYILYPENKDRGTKSLDKFEANDIDIEIKLQLVLNEPLYWKEIKTIKKKD